MIYAKLVVKTGGGIKQKFFEFETPLIFGKYLVRYYKDKEYEWEELTESQANTCKNMLKTKFKSLK